MNLIEAFGQFVREARSRRLTLEGDCSGIQLQYSKRMVAAADGAKLRLCWDSLTRSVVLEITHGPSGQEFWLDLFSADLEEEGVDLVDNIGPIQDAMAYGFELMDPNCNGA